MKKCQSIFLAMLAAGFSCVMSTQASDSLVFDHPIAIDGLSGDVSLNMTQQQTINDGSLQVQRLSSDKHDAERFLLSNSGRLSREIELSDLSLNVLFRRYMAISDDGITVTLYQVMSKENMSGQVVVAAGETVILESDFDNDGMADGWELSQGLDMYADDSEQHRDDDGLSNINEFLSGTNPNFHHSDTDVLCDHAEVMVYGTDPHKKDTDEDGFNDHCEVIDGADPLDPSDVPSHYAKPADCPYENFFSATL